MAQNSPHQRVALAAAKWYLPFNRQLLEACELRPLPLEADSSDEVTIDFTPTIAFPTALLPKTVFGKSPLDLKPLFFSPLIVRLHYVAQLSTTSLRANIDAKHCRLSHALGTICILSAFIEILVTRMKAEGKVADCCYPDGREVLGAFTYAALHDAFQGPFGHALDSVREDLVGGLHANRRLDKTLLNFIVGSALSLLQHGSNGDSLDAPAAIQALCDTVEETVAKPNNISSTWLLQWVYQASLSDFTSLDSKELKRRQELSWLYDLLEGPVDADRWDYLWRDTLHLGLTRSNKALLDLLHDFWDDMRVHWDGVRSRLTVSERIAKRLGVGFFALRKSLYKNVYENPEKRVIDSILIRCIHLGLLSEVHRPENWATHDQRYLEFLVDLTHITDTELLSILERVNDPILAHLARELRTYPAVRIFWSEVLREVEIESVVNHQDEKLEEFNYRGILPPSWATLPQDEGEDVEVADRVAYALRETLQRLQRRVRHSTVRSLGAPYLPSLLLHCSIMPKRPARVLQFERIAWKLVARQLRDSGVIEKIYLAIRKTIASAHIFGTVIPDDSVSDLLDRCPPFFISFPWIPSFSNANMQEMSRDPAEKLLSVRVADQIIQDKSPADLMPRAGDSETYIVVAGYPLFITGELNEIEREKLESAGKWAVRGLIELGCCLALPRDLVNSKSDPHILAYLVDKLDGAKA